MSGNSKERARVRKIGARFLDDLGRILDEAAVEISNGELTVEELCKNLKDIAAVLRDPKHKTGNHLFGSVKKDYLED